VPQVASSSRATLPAAEPSARQVLICVVEAPGKKYAVRLTTDDGRTAECDFDLDVLATSRMAGVLGSIEAGTCVSDDLRDLGAHLWDALLHGDVERLFETVRPAADGGSDVLTIRLSLPPKVALYPWEALYDERRSGFISVLPNYSIVHASPELSVPKPPPRERQPLAALVVIPEGSGLNVDHEWNNLQLTAAQLGDAIQLEPLMGRVTPLRLQKQLRSRRWDVLHYIGHGVRDDDDHVRIRLHSERESEDDYWMEAEPFSTLFVGHGPRLVILNCCLGGAPDPRRTLAGLGPLLMRAGVPAVIAMRYEIPDDVAIRMSDAFYRELLSESAAGHVDFALRAARHAVHLNQRDTTVRGFITPMLHLAEGSARLFDLPSQNRPAPVPTPAPVQGAESRLPEELVQAIRDRQCVVVLGSLCSAPLRGAGVSGGPAPAPGPLELAKALALQSSYPRVDELSLARSSESWLASLLLAAVCQHYQGLYKRLPLLKAIQSAYLGCPPPEALLALASWDLPGVICTQFDGLMEEAFKRLHRTPRGVPDLEQTLDAAADVPMLVQLRGSLNDARSLVLTEDDHDRLWDKLARLPSQVLQLAKGPGRSALFVGVSPRDPLVRRLALQLFETGENRVEGPTFFASTDHTSAEDSYWRKYDVTWVSMEAATLIAALDQAVRPGGAH
jgi:hypothetical protein